MQLQTLVNRANESFEMNEIYRQAIINSRWHLLIAGEGSFFVTSDNPGFSITPADDKIYNSKFNEGFSFYFPISPSHCLFITDFEMDDCYSEQKDNKIITRTTISSDFVLWINDNSIQNINELIIASDDWYLSQIMELNKPKK